MAHHVCLLLMCLFIGCLADDIISSLVYSFDTPLPNGIVYTLQELPVTITVTVDSFSAGNPLSLSFSNDAMTHFTNIKVVSACKTVGNVDMFSIRSGGLVAGAPITKRTACTYAGVILPTEANQVMENLYNEGSGSFPVAPFTIHGGYLGGYWRYGIVRAGATALLTIDGDVAFEVNQGFIITASNGSPFTSAGACIDNDGAAVFNVNARGTRLLLVARTPLSKAFTCDIEVVVGQTYAKATNYTATAPELGVISCRFAPVLGLLDTEDYHICLGRTGLRVGVSNWAGEGLTGSATTAAVTGTATASTSTAGDDAGTGSHVLSIGIPAAAIEMEDSLALHYRAMERAGLGQCVYADGTPVGPQREVVDAVQYALIGAQASMLITLSAPPQPSADGYVYVHCPVQALGPAPALVIAAVSVRGGVFAVRRPDTHMTALQGYDVFSTSVNAAVTSYGTNFTAFSVEVFSRNRDAYDYMEVDVSLRGVTFADVTEVYDKCVFLRRPHEATGAPEPWLPSDVGGIGNMSNSGTPAGVVVLEEGEVRVQLDESSLATLGEYVSFTCTVAAEEGQVISIYDTKLGKTVVSDTVRATSLAITFGDGVQTHWMAPDAVPVGVTVPLAISLAGLYVPAAVEQGYDGVTIRIRSYGVNITTVDAFAAADDEEQTIELECSAGHATAIRRSGITTTAAGEAVHAYRYSELTIAVHGFAAECRGAVVLSAQDSPLDVSLNTVELLMTRSTSGLMGYFTAFSSAAYADVVAQPLLLTTQQFSFRSAAVTLGEEAAFTVGHALLPAQGSFTLTFDADVSTVAPTCSYTDATATEAVPMDVLQCTRTQRAITCVKLDVALTHACTLGLTLAPDFLRRVAATATFTGLPAGTVFAPTFAIPVQPTSGTVTVAPVPATAGRAVVFSLSLPRPLRRTDILSFTHVNGDVDELFFDSFTPTRFTYGFTTSTVGDTVYISLDNLPDTAATKEFKVQFAHVVHPPAYPSDSLTIQFQVNGVKFPAVTPTFIRDLVRTVGYVPSAASTRYNVVQIHHGGLISGDTLALPTTNFEPKYFPILHCGATRIGGYSGVFYINDMSFPPEEPCYAMFPAFTALKPYWVVTLRRNNTVMYMYARATRNTAVGMEVREPPGVYIVGVAANLTVVFYDITTAFLTETGYISFAYDNTLIDITEASCPGLPSTVSDTAVVVTLEMGSIPLADLRTLECTVHFTPRAASTAPALTRFNILDKDYPDVPLKPFQADYHSSITITPSTTPLWRGAVVEFNVIISQLALEAGDRIFFHSSDSAEALIEWTSCVGHGVHEGEILVHTTIPLSTLTTTTFACTGTVRYASFTSVPYVAVLYTAVDNTLTIDATAPMPPAYTDALAVSEAAQTPGAVTYRATRYALPGVHFTTFNIDNYDQHGQVGLHSDCSVHNRTHGSVTVAFTTTTTVASSVCGLTVTFTAAYHPAVLPYALSLQYTRPTQALVDAGDAKDAKAEELVNIAIPSMQVPTPSLLAHATASEVRFLFTNATTDTLTVDNAWDITATATAPLSILSLADHTTVGYLRAAMDGRSLISSFNEGIVVTIDGKYTLTTPCYFRTTDLHDTPLQSQAATLSLSLGPLQRRIFLKSTGYGLRARTESPRLLPDSTFTLQLRLALTGNRGVVTVDYTNTGLASVQNCVRAANSTDTGFAEPLLITTATIGPDTGIAAHRDNDSGSNPGSGTGRSGIGKAMGISRSFSFALTEETVVGDDSMHLDFRCTFNTLSSEAARAQTQARALSETVSLAITAARGEVPGAGEGGGTADGDGGEGAPVPVGVATVLFRSQVRIPLPYHAPNALGLTQTVNFTRATSFDAGTIAFLTRIYARALRTVVTALLDDQVAVTQQRLHTPVDVEGDADVDVDVASVSVPVPYAIVTMFPVASTTTRATAAVGALAVGGTGVGSGAGGSVGVAGDGGAGRAVVSLVVRTASTTTVPVTADDAVAAAPAIATAFAEVGLAATFGPMADTEVVDGDCTVRCGVRCALCAPGEVCAEDSECVNESCTSDHVCASELLPPRPPKPPGPLVPDTDNAAPATEFLIAVLMAACAVIVL